jgi:O-antigen/teichoic acid export membrane protein
VKLARTGSHVMMWRALQKLTGALAVLVIAHGLGPVGNGRFSLTLLLVTVLAAVLSGGVGLASVPYLRQQRAAAGRVLAAQAGWLLLVLAALVVVAIAVRQGPAWVWLHHELGWDLSLLLAAVVWVLALLAFETANYDLLACGEVVTGSRTSALRSLVHLIAVCGLLLWLRLDLAAAIWSMTLVYLAAAAWMVQRARAALWRLPPPEEAVLAAQPPLPVLAGRLVRNGWLGQLSALSYLLMLRLDQLLIESYLDVAAVGIYAMAAWGAELLWLVPEALNPLLVHSSANALYRGRDRTAARAVRLGLWVTILAAVPLALLAEPLLGLLRGGVYLPAVPALWVLLPGVVAFVPGVILAGDFIGRGVPHWNTQASAVTLALNVVLCLLWIPRLGILGAAWSSTVAYAFGSALMIWRFRRVTGLSWREILLPQLPWRHAG